MNNELPSYIKNKFKFRDNVKNLGGINKLVLPRVHATRYGLKSVIYTASKGWNALPDNIHIITSRKRFKAAVINLKLS